MLTGFRHCHPSVISSSNCIPFQACRILLSYGCDTTIVSLQGYTAAQLATESVAKILAEEPVHQAGADIEYQLLEAAKAGE